MRAHLPAVVLCLLLACGGEAPSPNPADADPPGLTDLSEDDLRPGEFDDEWYTCESGVECLELDVPIDYGYPMGPTVSIAITRVRAWTPSSAGVILVNPGGPGAPGRDFAELLDGRRAFGFLRQFDLIGFDPRGVGGSGSTTCGSARSRKDVFVAGGVGGLVQFFKEEGEECAQRLGPLFNHLGSHTVVRDIDAIRRALGEEKLNFLGISYGTRLGALYAETFPEHTRAVVLDAPVAPEADLVELSSAQFEALVAGAEEFYDDCDAGRLECPLDAAAAGEELWQHAVRTGSEDLFAGFWRQELARSDGRQDLAEFLGLYSFFPDVWDELVDLSSGASGGSGVNETVHCSDQAAPMPPSAELEALFDGFSARAPAFALGSLGAALCAGWPVEAQPVQRLSAPESPPLLLIGGRHDVLTPLSFAREMDASLVNSVLVESDHFGHGAMFEGNECVDDMVDTYFGTLELPEPGTTCP